MLIGIAWLFALLVVWFEVRHPRLQTFPQSGRNGWCPADVVALLLILVAHLPLLSLLIAWARLPGYLPGDARTHALVAYHLTADALWSGWAASYVGGFPLAVHYPIVGWLVIGLPMRFGVDPTRALQAICSIAVVATSLVAYLLGRINRVGIVASLAAALFIAWISPLNSFVGGFETYFVTGLVSQVLVMPFVLCWVGTCFGSLGSFAGASAFAGLSFLVHPQVATATTVLLGLLMIACPVHQARRRYLVSATMAGTVALLVYGTAAIQLQLPFGWPINLKWMQLGFGPERLDDWFIDGDLLDRDRAPIATALWAGCFTLAIVRMRHPVARAVVAASIGSVFLSTLGPAIDHSGRLGKALLTVFQPLRAMALIPVAAAATVMFGLEHHRDTAVRLSACIGRFFVAWRARRTGGKATGFLEQARVDRWSRWLRLGTLMVIGLPMAVAAMDSRNQVTRKWIAELDDYDAEHPCGSQGPNRSEWERLRVDLGSLSGGRLWFEDAESKLPGQCAQTTGFERNSSVAIANTAAVGAHVGLLTLANRYLAPTRTGLARRAEALGIGHVLTSHPLPSDATAAFKRVRKYGGLYLSSRVTDSGHFGVGCVRRRWSGQNAVLDQVLKARLSSDSAWSELLDPTAFLELAARGGPLAQADVTDACQSEGAVLKNATDSVSNHAVTVEALAPMDLVLRVTAHPTWQWHVDGKKVTPQLVFPGYYATRVAAGRHHVEVTHRPALTTIAGLLLALLGPMLIWLLPVQLRRRNSG